LTTPGKKVIKKLFNCKNTTIFAPSIHIENEKVKTLPKSNRQKMSKFADDIAKFIETEKWTFAKTMPEWPHEYIVRERVDEQLFLKTVEHIRKFGYNENYYSEQYTYFDHNGYMYWTMGAPIEETKIINRTQKENSYEERLRKGTLPKK
jgi:hypothetical protein